MATQTKFEQFIEDVLQGVHQFVGFSTASPPTAHEIFVVLTNAAPDTANDAVLADITQIVNGNGYTTGGVSALNSAVRSGATVTVTGTTIVWTAGPGQLGPFRYVVLYNNTPTSPVDPLISHGDRGSALTLEVDETFTVKFNNTDPTGTIFTAA
jgi:hypothetical protein